MERRQKDPNTAALFASNYSESLRKLLLSTLPLSLAKNTMPAIRAALFPEFCIPGPVFLFST